MEQTLPPGAAPEIYDAAPWWHGYGVAVLVVLAAAFAYGGHFDFEAGKEGGATEWWGTAAGVAGVAVLSVLRRLQQIRPPGTFWLAIVAYGAAAGFMLAHDMSQKGLGRTDLSVPMMFLLPLPAVLATHRIRDNDRLRDLIRYGILSAFSLALLAANGLALAALHT